MERFVAHCDSDVRLAVDGLAVHGSNYARNVPMWKRFGYRPSSRRSSFARNHTVRHISQVDVPLWQSR